MPIADSPFLVYEGDTPLLITLIHGATPQQSRHGLLPERQATERLKRYEYALFPLLAAILAGLAARHHRPHLVIPLIHRSRIDFNRGKIYRGGERAYDDPQAEPLYDAFERLVATTLDRTIGDGEQGLLIDLHGCTTDTADLFLGSLNGRTISRINGRAYAYDTLRAAMLEHGWRVAPLPDQPEIRYHGREDGLIGRHNRVGRVRRFAAIQIEVAYYIRADAALRNRFGADLAAAIVQALIDEE